jgi:F-type H+-transporting ATPase subunit b
MMRMFFEAEFWVGAAFVVFLGILAYVGVPKLIGKQLDDRAAAIKKEIDDARRLRDEAQALLADYKKRREQADQEAAAIIEQAKREADAASRETQASLEESLARRTRIAEEKIARAQAQAVAEVRSAAIDAAVAASERLIGGKLARDGGNTLIDDSIRDLKSRLS